MRPDVHAGGVPPEKNGLSAFAASVEVIERGLGDFLVNRLHALLASGPVLSIFCVPSALAQVWITPRVAELFDHRRVFEVVGILELFLGVEVIERAEELIEPVRGGQVLVEVAEVVLAELRGHVALRLEQFCDGHVARLQAFLRAGQTDLEHAGAKAGLAGDEARATGGAALLAIPVGEVRTFLGDAVNVRRLVAHHAVIVHADVEPADVVAPDHEDVGLLVGGVGWGEGGQGQSENDGEEW